MLGYGVFAAAAAVMNSLTERAMATFAPNAR